MLDPILTRLWAPYRDRIAGPLRGRGQIVSLTGFAVSLIGAALIARHFVWPGLAVFALGLVLSALSEQPRDFLFATMRFAAMPFAFALDSPERALSLIFLLFGMTTEMVACTRLGPGVIGASEWLLVFVLLAIFPGGLVAYLAGVLCFVVAGSRRIA